MVTLWSWLLDQVFPPRCIGCQRRGIALCDACRDELPYLPRGVRLRCTTRRGVMHLVTIASDIEAERRELVGRWVLKGLLQEGHSLIHQRVDLVVDGGMKVW